MVFLSISSSPVIVPLVFGLLFMDFRSYFPSAMSTLTFPYQFPLLLHIILLIIRWALILFISFSFHFLALQFACISMIMTEIVSRVIVERTVLFFCNFRVSIFLIRISAWDWQVWCNCASWVVLMVSIFLYYHIYVHVLVWVSALMFLDIHWRMFVYVVYCDILMRIFHLFVRKIIQHWKIFTIPLVLSLFLISI